MLYDDVPYSIFEDFIHFLSPLQQLSRERNETQAGQSKSVQPSTSEISSVLISFHGVSLCRSLVCSEYSATIFQQPLLYFMYLDFGSSPKIDSPPFSR